MSKLWGAWDKFKSIPQRIYQVFGRDRVQKEINDIAEWLLEEVKTNIRQGNLELAPLSSDYGRRKDTSLPILVKTGEWVDNLSVEKAELNSENLTIFIGGSKDKTIDVKSGITVPMDVFTDWIEYGRGDLPARPAITMTWEEIKHDAQKRIIKVLKSEVFDLGIIVGKGE